MKLVISRDIQPHWPEYVFTGKGQRIRTTVAMKLPAEDLASCYYVGPDGFKVKAWAEAGYYIDDDGEALAPVGHAMPRAELESLGFDDKQLDKLWREHFDEPSGIDPKGLDSGPQQLRRRVVFDAVMAKEYA